MVVSSQVSRWVCDGGRQQQLAAGVQNSIGKLICDVGDIPL